MSLRTWIYTLVNGALVGRDEFGNRYFRGKGRKLNGRERRWVIYKGEIDASKISNEWYSWIHFINNRIEKSNNITKYNWQKPHLSNQTGTNKSYHPNKKNNEISKKYKSWKN